MDIAWRMEVCMTKLGTGYWHLINILSSTYPGLTAVANTSDHTSPTSVTSPNVTIVWCLRYWYRKFNSSKKWRFYHVLSMPPRLLATAPAPPWLESAASNIVRQLHEHGGAGSQWPPACLCWAKIYWYDDN